MKYFRKHSLALSLMILSCFILLIYGYMQNDITIYGTFLSLVPPLVSILLALVTKEVYSSLFIGILVGGLIYSGFSFEGTFVHIFENGIIETLVTRDNVCILIFLVLLGSIVSLMNESGASKAFGDWALKHIKSKKQAELATILLGIMIFVDDNFNCLTVGNVMHPITDKFHVSNEKLAYLIDSTAAPICIIAPISSWAAAVSGFVGNGDGFMTFVRTIPYNFYALFTIVMVISSVLLNVDFGPMKDAELLAVHHKLAQQKTKLDEMHHDKKGKICDLILPIVFLIICCTLGILYTGGLFDGNGFFESFSNGSAALGLMYGSFFAFILTIILYVSRKIIPFDKCAESLAEGFKIMIPAMLILTLAWTLKVMTDSLGSTTFVKNLIGSSLEIFSMFMPAFMFVVGALIAFATGTSWGTFGILIPIVINVFSGTDPNMMIISISACMAGSVCGDHSSPISDTTIMASAGAKSNHIAHVTTQFPYVLLVAVISFITYLLTAFITNALILIIIGSMALIASLILIKHHQNKKI